MGDEAVLGGLCLAGGLCLLAVSEQKTDNSLLGASCALFALRLLLEPNIDDEKWSESRNRILDWGAQLLGLLVWSTRKEEYYRVKCELLDKLESAERDIEELKSWRSELESAERDIEELKSWRSEDAKANEKVVSIFATHEQSWFNLCEHQELLGRKARNRSPGMSLIRLSFLCGHQDCAHTLHRR